MSPTKQLILGTDPNAYLSPVQGWKQTVATLESRTETFKGHVDKPGGTYWEGQFAEAAQSNAGEGLKTVGSIRDTVDTLADEVTSTVTYSVLPPLSTAKAIINHAETQQGVRVNDDLTMTYTPPPGMSEQDIEKSRRAVATMAKELKDNADKWWAATQTVKTQIEAAEKTISGELNLAAATFNVNNAVEQSRTADVPAATKDSNFYKDWYPASDAPGTTQAASAAPAAADPNAPKLGPPSPEGKPFQPDPRAGSLTGNLGALGITDPKSPLEQPRPTDPRTTPAPKLDPSTPQGKAAIDTMRKYLQNTVPADQVETKLADAINSAQQDRPMVATPEPGAPQERVRQSGGEAFAEAWDKSGRAIDDLVGNNGGDHAKEAWTGVAKGLWDAVNPDPVHQVERGIDTAHGAIDEVESGIDNPKAFVGRHGLEIAAGIATAPLGGEGALLGTETRAGLHGLEDTATPGAHTELTHGIPDTPGTHHTPTTGGEHGSIGADHGGPTVSGTDFGAHSAPAHPPYSSLPEYAQQALDRAADNSALRQDLINHGVPQDIANSAQHNPYAGMTHQDIIGDHYTPRGGPNWPPHDGFANGKWETLDRIPENVHLDRIGEVSGSRGDFMATQGDPYPSRALAPGSSGDYHTFQGTGKPLRSDWELRWGQVEPAFGQPGGGTQWVVVDKETGDHILVDTLIRDGYLR